jgi:hypothetical protein
MRRCTSIEVSDPFAWLLFISEDTKVSLHLEEIKKHAILEPPLDRISKATIPVKVGADWKEYYEVEYKIQARYYSAHCEHSLWFGGKDHGSVKVDYV